MIYTFANKYYQPFAISMALLRISPALSKRSTLLRLHPQFASAKVPSSPDDRFVGHSPSPLSIFASVAFVLEYVPQETRPFQFYETSKTHVSMFQSKGVWHVVRQAHFCTQLWQ